MATSGFYTHSIKSGYSLRVEWSAEQNVSNNTSFITADLYVIANHSLVSTSPKTAWIEIDGNRTTINNAIIGTSGSKRHIMTATRTLNHNSDGTKSFTLRTSLQFDFSFSGSYTGTVTTTVRSFTLSTIPRGSSLTLNTIPNIRDDILQSFNVTINRANANFTHRIQLYNGTSFIQDWTGLQGGSMNLTLTNSGRDRLLDSLPSSTSGTFQFRLRTYDGSGSTIGDTNVNTTITLNTAYVKPTLGTVTKAESNNLVINSGLARYVEGVSRIRIDVGTYAAPRGATVASVRITYDGATSTILNPSGALNRTFGMARSGTRSLEVTVTDSRGITNTNIPQGTVYVWPYSQPRITRFNTYRSNTAGDPVEDSTRIAIDRVVSISTVDNLNRVRWRSFRKLRTSSTWEPLTSWSTYGTAATRSGLTTHISFALDVAHDIRIEFQDYLFTSDSESLIPTEAVAMSWSKTGMGIGKLWEKGALDIRGSVFLTGTMVVTDVSGTGEGEGGEAIRVGEDRNMALSLYGNSGVIYLNRDTFGNNPRYFRLRSHATGSTFRTDFSIEGDGRVRAWQGLYADQDITAGADLVISSPNSFFRYGGDKLIIGYWTGAATLYPNRSDGNIFRIRSHHNESTYRTDFLIGGTGNARFYGDLQADGNKNVIQTTESYGRRLMNALETPDSRFVTYEEYLLNPGIHTIEIEPMFRETISEYFVVPHVQNDTEVVLISRSENTYTLLVKGAEMAEVVIEINGRRKGFEGEYMTEYIEPVEEADPEITHA